MQTCVLSQLGLDFGRMLQEIQLDSCSTKLNYQIKNVAILYCILYNMKNFFFLITVAVDIQFIDLIYSNSNKILQNEALKLNCHTLPFTIPGIMWGISNL